MKMLILFAVLVSVFALTTAKPVKEEDRLLAKREEKSDPEDVLVTESSTTESSGTESSGTEDEAEEDGSTIDEEPRSRAKRNAYEDLEDEEKMKDSSGADSKEENGDDNEETNDDTSGDDRLQEHKLQWKNTLGIRGPFTITAYQPPESEISSKKGKKKNNQFSMDFVSPSGNIEITPFAPAINSLKKVRRRCLCPLPCGAEYELIGCSGPYTVPCGGGFGGLWPGLGCGGCGGCGGYGGLYGLGGCGGFGGGYPLYGGGLGLGGCGGCGGCGGYGGCGCGGCGGGCCGGGCCGFPMMCCCK